ncbi:Uncharacterised protein [Mycobacterium tuberculosis]|nr:Uncharacterised protein [Mycobacterium tuberculosis]
MLFQRLHVLGQLVIFGDRLGDLALPRFGLCGQVRQRHLDVEHVLDPAQQRNRRLRVRWVRHIVRHRRPKRHRRDAGPHTGRLEDAGDAGGALVACFLKAELPRRRRGVGRARDRHRPGVWGVGQQRPQDHHGVHVEFVDDRQQLVAKRAPAHIRLHPAHQHHVAVAAGWAAVRDPHGRPLQFAGNPIDLADDRPIDLVVVVGLVIDLDNRQCLPAGRQVCHGIAGRVAGVVPALERSHDDGVVQFGQRCVALRWGHLVSLRRPPGRRCEPCTSSEAARLVAMATLCRAEVGTLCACLS